MWFTVERVFLPRAVIRCIDTAAVASCLPGLAMPVNGVPRGAIKGRLIAFLVSFTPSSASMVTRRPMPKARLLLTVTCFHSDIASSWLPFLRLMPERVWSLIQTGDISRSSAES